MNLYLTIFFINLFIALSGQLLLKKGVMQIGEVTLFSKGLTPFFKTIWKVFTNKTVLAGVFFFSGSALLWLVILSG